MMQRVGFTFRIRPELKDEYKKAHDNIWPEMAEAIRKCGIHNYSIYFKPDGTLFAYLEVEGDYQKQMARLSGTDVNKRWQEYMDRFFVKEDGSVTGPEIENLEEVFHLD
jgi:L-rhamnose mutarotase